MLISAAIMLSTATSIGFKLKVTKFGFWEHVMQF